MNIFIATVHERMGILTSDESWHCARVLRKKAGDRVKLIDGKGNFFEGTFALVSDKKCEVNIVSGPTSQVKRSYYLHLAIAPTKQIDRVEWMVEKAVEIGIDEISFITCKNSERTSVKTERIMKIVESAVKQSLQAFLPKVNALIPLKDLIADDTCSQKLIAHCFDVPKKEIKEVSFSGRSTLVLVGPEGDFTWQEVEEAGKHGVEAISLGNTRLRSETAGLYICQAASLLS